MKALILLVVVILVVAILILLFNSNNQNLQEGFRHIKGIENSLRGIPQQPVKQFKAKNAQDNTPNPLSHNKITTGNVERRSAVYTQARNVAAIFDAEDDYVGEFGISRSEMMKIATERKQMFEHTTTFLPRNPSITFNNLKKVQTQTYNGIQEQVKTNKNKEDFLINYYRNMDVDLDEEQREKKVNPPISQNDYIKMSNRAPLTIKDGILQ